MDAARSGDPEAFDHLVRPLRSELHAHCYRMLGSAHDADDALQEALVRAWRALATFEGRGSLRSWLYTVATRSCLDLARSRDARALPIDLGPSSDRAVVDDSPRTDVAWLGPWPDLDDHGWVGGGTADPQVRYERREAVELAFVAALQHLPGNQRAALVLFDVVGFAAAEIADIMQTSVASVNSALQRARAVVAARIPAGSQQRTLRALGDARVRELAAGFASALERGDSDGLVALLTEDVSWSMPPLPHWYRGVRAVADFAARVPFRCGSWRYRLVGANGQPAVAFYLRDDTTPPWQDTGGSYRAWSITVLTLRDDRIADIVTFLGPEHFPRFGLRPSLADSGSSATTEVDG